MLSERKRVEAGRNNTGVYLIHTNSSCGTAAAAIFNGIYRELSRVFVYGLQAVARADEPSLGTRCTEQRGHRIFLNHAFGISLHFCLTKILFISLHLSGIAGWKHFRSRVYVTLLHPLSPAASNTRLTRPRNAEYFREIELVGRYDRYSLT